MKITDKKFIEFKNALEQENGYAISDENVYKAIEFVEFLAKTAVDVTLRKVNRQVKLKESPNGFLLEDGGTCIICGQHASGENSWYDKYGIKCMTCQKAIDQRIIPRTLGTDKDSFYTDTELDIFFNLKGRVLNEFIRKKVLKVRIIPALDRGRHLRVFLLKDNKGFLPPKKLLSAHWVRDDQDGTKEYACLPWYYFHDPKSYLKKYQISAYMKLVPLENNL